MVDHKHIADRKKNKIFFIPLIALAAIAFIFVPSVSHASWLADLLGDLVGTAGEGFANLVGSFLSMIVIPVLSAILSFIAGLIDFGLDLGNRVTNLEAVTTGWNIVLSVTNLGFVLAIIVIAFATIFRIEGYEMRRTLVKLIVAALLVNFSMVIAGAFLSVSNVFVNYLQTAAFSEQSISSVLGGAFQPQVLLAGPDIPTAADGANAFGSAMISLIFVVIAFFIIILTIATLVLMLLYRFFMLAFLLILSPIVWLMWVFPGTQQYWRQWWGEFIRWTFFAPIVLFFVYLAAATATVLRGGGDRISEVVTGAVGSEGIQALANNTVTSQDFFTNLLNSLILVGLLIGGIFVANKIGINGGNIGVQLGGQAAKLAWGGTKYWGGRAVTRPVRGATAQKALEDMQKAGKKRGGVLGFVQAKIATAGRVAGIRSQEGLSQKSAERLKGMSANEALARFSTMSAVDKAAVLQNQLKGKEEKLSDEDIKALFGQAKTSEQVENAYGRYGANAKKSIKTAMQRKGVTPETLQLGDSLKGATGEVREQISKELDGHLKKLFASMTPKELSAVAAEGKWFTQDNQLAPIMLEATADIDPGAIGNAIAKAKGEDIDRLIKVISKTKYVPEEIEVPGGYLIRKGGEKIPITHKINKQNATPSQIMGYINEQGREDIKNKERTLFASLSRGISRRTILPGEETTSSATPEEEGGGEKKA